LPVRCFLIGGEAGACQRRFTADAAHELRTPLTGVKLQFQLLARSQTEQERQEAIAQLSAGIEQAIRLVNQLLTLARLEPDSVAATHLAVALGALYLLFIVAFGRLFGQPAMILAAAVLLAGRLAGAAVGGPAELTERASVSVFSVVLYLTVVAGSAASASFPAFGFTPEVLRELRPLLGHLLTFVLARGTESEAMDFLEEVLSFAARGS